MHSVQGVAIRGAHPTSRALYTVTDVAQRAAVQPSSIVRFADDGIAALHQLRDTVSLGDRLADRSA
jgi:hypothetical protein